MTEKTKGHGYFRKKKWAKGLVSGVASETSSVDNGGFENVRFGNIK